jgi:hypothetical protein
MKLEDIISELIGEMNSNTGSYVEPMDIDPDMEPEVIADDDDETVDELNSTATTGDMAYNTPGAFRKTDGTEDEEESGFNDGHKDPEVFGYKKATVSKRNFESKDIIDSIRDIIREELNEVTYRQYKYDKSASPKEKVNKSIHTINSQLIKIERIIQQNIKLKQESGVDNQQYWKSTRTKFQKTNERLMRISGKLRELWR